MRWLALALAACAPLSPRPALPLALARIIAERSSQAAFVAEQHIVFDDGKDRRESSALFFVRPGEAYRLRVLGPLGVTAFDVQARCGHYRISVPSQNRVIEGELGESQSDRPFFPATELWQVLLPVAAGEWQGERWSDGERAAWLDVSHGAFSRLESARGIRIEVKRFIDVGALSLPKDLDVFLPRGQRLHIENRQISTDVPEVAQMVADVRCLQ